MSSALVLPEEGCRFATETFGGNKIISAYGDKLMYVVLFFIHFGYENKKRLFPYTALTDWFF